MKNAYIYDTKRGILQIYGNPIWSKPNTTIKIFCKEYNIKLEDFNLPVEIDSSVINCNELFKDCIRFNQKVVIPDGVKSCSEMFYHCKSFNQSIVLPESIEMVYCMFGDCKVFNQEVKIPDCVKNSSGMFMGCESLNQRIVLSQNTVICEAMFKQCKSFNQEIILPEKVEDCACMFEDCIKFNQPIVLNNNITNCWRMLYGCESLNQLVQLLSIRQYCSEDMFRGCSSLLPENVTIYSRKINKKSLEKKLQKMWGIENITEEIKSKTNIITVKNKKKVEIKDISYFLGNKINHITIEQIEEMTLQDTYKQIEKIYTKENLSGLKISAKSDNFMNTLCVYFDKAAFCIGIIDDWKETVLLYDSGEGEEMVSIQGDYYPKHMVSNNKELLFMIIDEFLQSGRPTKKVKLIRG